MGPKTISNHEFECPSMVLELGGLGTLLGTFWSVPGRSSGVLGHSRDVLRHMLERSGAQFG